MARTKDMQPTVGTPGWGAYQKTGVGLKRNKEIKIEWSTWNMKQ